LEPVGHVVGAEQDGEWKEVEPDGSVDDAHYTINAHGGSIDRASFEKASIDVLRKAALFDQLLALDFVGNVDSIVSKNVFSERESSSAGSSSFNHQKILVARINQASLSALICTKGTIEEIVKLRDNHQRKEVHHNVKDLGTGHDREEINHLDDKDA
jgi:hypothetical protein